MNLDAYLERLGRPERTLPAVVAAHAATIPFENLDPLTGTTPRLDLPALEEKLVQGGRGGWCFEHNLLLAHALEAMGFKVQRLAARVLWNQPPGAITARSHMLLLVDDRWIVDVGFGGLTLTGVLELACEDPQPTTHEDFRLRVVGDERHLEARVRDAWQPLYRFDLQPQYQLDYEVSNHFLATHPSSIFLHNLMAARATPEARYALRNGKLSIYRPGGVEQRELASVGELKEVLATMFEVKLPAGDALDAALARVLG